MYSSYKTMNLLPVFRYSVSWLLPLLLLVSLAQSQQFGRNKIQYETFDYKKIETDHFVIHYYPEMEPYMPKIARQAERWYERLSSVTGHEFEEGDRKPLIFYADDADFRQTNIVPGFIPGGVRGLAEPAQDRVVMPLAPNHNVTHQVLGHELVHSFQFDFAGRAGINTRQLPLWLMEGMAEYYSIGRRHTETAMWMRDAVLSDQLPTFEDIDRQDRYNPYRYGHAFMAYLGGTYGDETIIDYFQAVDAFGPRAAVDSIYGIEAEALINDWHQSLRDLYLPLTEDRTPADETGRIILSQDKGHGRINLAPSLSPDGDYVAFLTESIPEGIDLKVARVETGEVIANLGSVHTDPHLDDIRFLTSGGTWDPDGENLAFITFAEGQNELAIWNVKDESIEQSIRLEGLPALEDPAWSPDGSRIAVSGVTGAESNIFVYDLEHDSLHQITDDIHSALQPNWSPDGRTIAFLTDGGPGGTDMDDLDIRPARLALADADGDSITYLSPFGETNYSNPRFSADGESLYFIAAPDGFLDVFRHDLTTEENYRVTKTRTGIAGITDESPALTIARNTGTLMFSTFSGDRYHIASFDPDENGEELMEHTEADPDAPGGILPPYDALGENVIAGYLADPSLRLLPADTEFEEQDYERSWNLTGIMPPQIGVGIGGPGGTQAGGGAGLLFSDLFNHYDLAVALGFEVRGDLWDISGMTRYISRRHRINYGGMIQRSPQTFATAFATEDPETGARVLNRMVQRVTMNQASLLLEYPLSTTRRFETTLGGALYTFDRWVEQYQPGLGGLFDDPEREDLEARDNIYFGTASLAYVVDTSYMGFTAPIQGRRTRLQATPFAGSVQFLRLMADTRRYLFFEPLTLAGRIAHHGNYWADEEDPFSTVYLGYPNSQTYVRGYDLFSFRADEFSEEDEDYAPMNRLVGTHAAVASIELRMPLLGTEQFGIFRTRFLPTDISLFFDGGVTWTRDDAPVFRFERDSSERIPVFSTGVSSRFNILGAIVLEFYVAYPFQRPERGTHFGFQFTPGW